MRLETTRFGTIDVAEEEVIRFSRGLYGFEEIDRYVLIDHREGSPFHWLQAVGRPDLAFVVMSPYRFCGDYEFTIPLEDSLALRCSSPADLLVLVVVGIPDDPAEMTANLKGPVVINTRDQVGRQVLLSGDQYSPRFRIVDNLRKRTSARRRDPGPWDPTGDTRVTE
jgi:flagellar assembly factor FliW